MTAPHILLVENDFETKRDVAILLFSNGFEVMPVSTAAEAIGALRLIRTDLVVTDVHLPDHDAGHLIQTVRASKTLRDLPVLVFSETPGDEEEARFKKLGASAYVSKDGSPDSLIAKVKELASVREESSEDSGGISGQLARLTTADLLRQLGKDRSSGVIVIDSSTAMEIHLSDGRIVHARHGITVGKKALYRCLRVADAAFNFQARDEEPEPTIDEVDLEALLAEAKMYNEKLMANFHKLPNGGHRIRVVPSESLTRANLRAEARAAVEIIKKYPRVADYVDRLNLPDIVCFEYLLTFIERGFAELVTENKPIKIFTDAVCDLPADWLVEAAVTVFPAQLQLGGQIFAGDTGDEAALYRLRPRRLEQAKLLPPEEDRMLKHFEEWVPGFDCLAIYAGLPGFYEHGETVAERLRESGVHDKPILANELTALNSHSFSLGLGLLVQHAVRLAAEGLPVEAVEEKTLAAMARLHMFFLVDPDRSYLVKKGGPPAILTWDGANFSQVGRLAKGEEAGAAMVREVRKRLDPKAPLHLALGHIRDADAARALKQELAGNLGISNPPIWPIGALIGSMLGEGALGVAFFQ